MLAAHLAHGVLEITDVPKPVPGPDEALIRIRTAGVCHSDLHLARGDWGIDGPLPLGHEGIGVVEALGPGAERFVAVGDRVILGLGGVGGAYWCGACRQCLRGRPHLCAQSKVLMGAFAEYIVVWGPALVVLPDGLSDLEVPLACGGLTAFGAIKKLPLHGVEAGRPIAIIGAAGGLGHYAVQIAGAFGYEVVGIDVGAERLAFVESLGASHAVDASDSRAYVAERFGGVDAALVFAARMDGFRLGFDLLGPGAVMVCVGIPPASEGNIELHPMVFSGKSATVCYSNAGTVEDMRELVHLAEAGRVRTHVSRTAALSELGAVFDELAAATFFGRAVLTDLAR